MYTIFRDTEKRIKNYWQRGKPKTLFEERKSYDEHLGWITDSEYRQHYENLSPLRAQLHIEPNIPNPLSELPTTHDNGEPQGVQSDESKVQEERVYQKGDYWNENEHLHSCKEHGCR